MTLLDYGAETLQMAFQIRAFNYIILDYSPYSPRLKFDRISIS